MVNKKQYDAMTLRMLVKKMYNGSTNKVLEDVAGKERVHDLLLIRGEDLESLSRYL